MDVLSGNTLLEAMDMCTKHKNANIGVMFANLWSFSDFSDAIYTEIKGGRIGGWKMNKCHGQRGYAVLESENGSFIHLINVQDPEKLKGRSFHWVLYEDGISEEVLRFAAYAERLPPLGCKPEESKELDDFLSSFRIV